MLTKIKSCECWGLKMRNKLIELIVNINQTLWKMPLSDNEKIISIRDHLNYAMLLACELLIEEQKKDE